MNYAHTIKQNTNTYSTVLALCVWAKRKLIITVGVLFILYLVLVASTAFTVIGKKYARHEMQELVASIAVKEQAYFSNLERLREETAPRLGYDRPSSSAYSTRNTFAESYDATTHTF